MANNKVPKVPWSKSCGVAGDATLSFEGRAAPTSYAVQDLGVTNPRSPEVKDLGFSFLGPSPL